MDKIEATIQTETVRRYELASEWEKAGGRSYSTPPERGYGNPRWIEVELAASERKRQALILLLLYYNAGWLDLEENESKEF